MREDIQFVTEFFQKLNNSNIEYCILRNADEAANGDAHDIDMTVDAARQAEAKNCLLETADLLGWRMHLETGDINDEINIKCFHLYKAVDNHVMIVHFDFFPTFSWEGYCLLTNSQLLQDINRDTLFHTASISVEAVTKLFIRLLHNGYVKDKYKEYIQNAFIENSDKMKETMMSFLDSDVYEYVVSTTINGDWKELEANRNRLIKSIKANSRDVRVNQKMYLIKKAIKKAGIMIAFEGTDGSGKSTIINGISNELKNSFPEGMLNYYHWRPGFIKKERKNADGTNVVVSEPHAKKPYGKLKSFAKFMFFNLDYILGYWCKVRLQIAKGHLVVFDRYYYDYYLDKIRYRLDISDRVLDFFRVMIPKPDITFVLIGDAQKLYERKKEISVEEIQQQIERLQKNKNKFNNAVLIDVNQSIEQVVFEVSKTILENSAERYNRR